MKYFHLKKEICNMILEIEQSTKHGKILLDPFIDWNKIKQEMHYKILRDNYD